MNPARRGGVLGLVAAAWLAGGARAQDDPRVAALPPEVRAALRTQVDSARAEDLPTEPLVLRALEGTSRGAPPARIALAVRTLRARFATARTALGGAPADEEYVAAAAALAAGVPAPALGELRTARARGSLSIPLVVASDLVARGVPAEAAVRAVLDLVSRGADDRTLLNLRAAVHEDIARGGTGRHAVETRARGILAALPPMRPPSPTITTSPAPRR